MSTETTVAGRLREAREAAGLSQGQAAKHLGIHRPTISEIEAGRRRVSTEEAKRFAELYGVSVAWIVSGASDVEVDAQILVAARELARLSQTDLDRLMGVIQMIRKEKKN